jgi:hypothetical protein
VRSNEKGILHWHDSNGDDVEQCKSTTSYTPDSLMNGKGRKKKKGNSHENGKLNFWEKI